MSAPNVFHAHIVVHHVQEIGFKIGFEQAHEEINLGAGTAQIVFERKGVQREPGQTDARCGLSDQLNALGPLLVALEPLEQPVAGPAAIAIHDDGHVLGQALRL